MVASSGDFFELRPFFTLWSLRVVWWLYIFFELEKLFRYNWFRIITGDRFRQVRVVGGARVDSGNEARDSLLQSVHGAAQEIAAKGVPYPADVHSHSGAGVFADADLDPPVQRIDDPHERLQRFAARQRAERDLVFVVICDSVIQVPGMNGAGERALNGVVGPLGDPEMRFRLVELLADDGAIVKVLAQKSGGVNQHQRRTESHEKTGRTHVLGQR
jgi:hypothetical protein